MLSDGKLYLSELLELLSYLKVRKQRAFILSFWIFEDEVRISYFWEPLQASIDLKAYNLVTLHGTPLLHQLKENPRNFTLF